MDDLASSGVKIRYIVPITNSNLEHAKELAKFVELRHFEVPIRLIATESECLLTFKADAGDPKELIRSNATSMVSKMRELLESIWTISTPAEERFRQLEGRAIETEFSKVVENPEDGFRCAAEMVSAAERYVYIATTSTGLKKLLEAYPFEKLHGKEIKVLCTITRDNIDAVQTARKFAEIRHTDETVLRATIVDDSKAMIVLKKPGEPHHGSVYSTDKNLVMSVKSFFNSLWENAVDASVAIEKTTN